MDTKHERTARLGLLLVAQLGLAPFVGATPPQLGHQAPSSAAATGAGTSELKLVPGDMAATDHFGSVVALDGDTLVVGSPGDDELGNDSGSAYVYVRGTSGWTLQAKLNASDGQADDLFGGAVDVHDDTIVVGAVRSGSVSQWFGAAYVFQRSGTAWAQSAKLTAFDSAPLDLFGASVAVWGDRILVGATQCFKILGPCREGAVYAFERSGGSWQHQDKLLAFDGAPGDSFGASVDLFGSTAVVAALWASPAGIQEAGAAYVFTETGASWSHQDKLVASDAAASDHLASVAIFEDTIVAGAAGLTGGAAYVFERSGSNWSEQTILSSSGNGSHLDSFGRSVAIHGGLIAVGNDADGEPNFVLHNSGAMHVFSRNGLDWVELAKLKASDAADGDFLGRGVAIHGTTAVAGSVGADPACPSVPYCDSGAVYVYTDLDPDGPFTYCTSKPSSLANCTPAVGFMGRSSASMSSGFVIEASPMPGGNLGLFVYGHAGAAPAQAGAFGDFCLNNADGLLRATPLPSGGAAQQCDGLLLFDWNAYAQAASGFDPASTIPGTTVNGQFWYRDPPSAGGANLTEALAFTVLP